jgi:hypothetical protein
MPIVKSLPTLWKTVFRGKQLLDPKEECFMVLRNAGNSLLPDKVLSQMAAIPTTVSFYFVYKSTIYC